MKAIELYQTAKTILAEEDKGRIDRENVLFEEYIEKLTHQVKDAALRGSLYLTLDCDVEYHSKLKNHFEKFGFKCGGCDRMRGSRWGSSRAAYFIISWDFSK